MVMPTVRERARHVYRQAMVSVQRAMGLRTGQVSTSTTNSHSYSHSHSHSGGICVSTA